MKDTTDTTEIAGAAPHEGEASPAVHWLLRARGPVLIDIEDSEGHHVGPIREAAFGSHARRHYSKVVDAYHIRQEEEEEQAPDKRRIRQIPDFPNLFEVAIPGVAYNPGRTFSWVSLLQPGKYNFQLLGRTACTVDIYWTGFSDTARLNTTFFHAIPMTAGDTASFEYNTVNPGALVVTFRNSAGTEQREITPTAILTPSESRDEIPPMTSITVVGDEAHVSATDNPGGSGVLHTLYTTDLLTFETLTPPILAPIPLPPDARLVMAFSIDRNGNREYPGAILPVLGLSQTRFVFRTTEGDPHVAPQLLRVVNRDPVPLTGPLEWMVAGDTGSWLRFEPREGRTPGVVTLSVDIDGLKQGTYNAILTINSPSPSTMFARQLVEVELLVEAGPGSPGVIV